MASGLPSSELGDYSLHENSPYTSGNSPLPCGLVGAIDVGCGLVSVEPATWGRLKSFYRE